VKTFFNPTDNLVYNTKVMTFPVKRPPNPPLYNTFPMWMDAAGNAGGTFTFIEPGAEPPVAVLNKAHCGHEVRVTDKATLRSIFNP
jgi:hypothetical protein